MASRQSHIFDGVNITKETAAFQLCDIHDPMLMDIIRNEDDLREVCDVSLFSHSHYNNSTLGRNETDGIQPMRSSESKPYFATNSSPCSRDMWQQTKITA